MNVEDQIKNDENLRHELNDLYSIDEKKAWQKIVRKRKTKYSLTKRIIWVSASAAAVLLLYLGINNIYTPNKDIVADNQIERIDYGDAYILMANGEKVALSSDTVMTTSGSGIVSFQKDAKFVKYKMPTQNVDKNAKNVVVVPKGKNLKIELSDGTIVCLNSDSKLTYPVTFREGHREVELSGEGYFDVVSNEKSPFIVKGDCLNVMVTGTKFNVNNYSSDELAQVTLVTGKVTVNAKTGGGKLLPNQQFTMTKESGESYISDVDVVPYTSWTQDKIYFKEMTLESLAIIFDRWYGVNLTFDDSKISKEIFTGAVYREDVPEQILTFITKASNLQWKVLKDGKVLIY